MVVVEEVVVALNFSSSTRDSTFSSMEEVETAVEVEEAEPTRKRRARRDGTRSRH